MFAMAQPREGRLRILAVSTGQRCKAQPDHSDDDGIGRPDGSQPVVGRDGAGGTPRADHRPAQPMVRRRSSAPRRRNKFLTASAAIPGSRTPDEAQAMFLKDIKEWDEYIRMAKIEPQG